MKQRFLLYRRGQVFYCQDNSTGKVVVPSLEEFEKKIIPMPKGTQEEPEAIAVS
jgi:hypothetical protein